MSVSRREFIGMMSAAAAMAGTVGAGCAAEPEPLPPGDDPLDLRRDFPVVMEGVYLNSPYITPSPQSAVDATIEFLAEKSRNPLKLRPMLGETLAARQKFARLVNASEGEVGLLSTTSEGENVVTGSLDFEAGDNVVIDDLHYETSYVLYSHLAETRGLDVRIVKNVDGAATPEAFAELVDDKTKLISVAWVSHQNGYRHDLKALAELAHAHNAYLYVDAIQGVGMLSLDVKQTGVDFFTAGTYKWLLGGFGVALFFVSERVMDLVKPDRIGWRQIEKDLGDHKFELYKDARKFGFATPAFAAVYQISAGLDYVMQVGVDKIEQHTVALAKKIHQGLTDQGFKVLTPSGNQSAIVAFEHGADYEKAQKEVDAAGIQLSFREDNTQIRVGAALFNNSQEIDQFLEVTGRWR